jgi:hypothetical protein
MAEIPKRKEVIQFGSQKTKNCQMIPWLVFWFCQFKYRSGQLIAMCWRFYGSWNESRIFGPGRYIQQLFVTYPYHILDFLKPEKFMNCDRKAKFLIRIGCLLLYHSVIAKIVDFMFVGDIWVRDNVPGKPATVQSSLFFPCFLIRSSWW